MEGGYFDRFNTGEPFRPDQFHWRADNQVKCIFVVRDEKDQKIVEELVAQHEQVNRILGSKIGFVLIFPVPPSSKTKRLNAKAVGELVDEYKIKPAYIAKHHSKWTTVAQLCAAFEISFSELPAMIVLTKAIPHEYAVLSLHRKSATSDIIVWLENLRTIIDRVDAAEHNVLSLESSRIHLKNYHSLVEAKKHAFGSSLERVARQLRVPEDARDAMTRLVLRTYGIDEAFDAVVKPYIPKRPSTPQARALRAARQDARRLEITYEKHEPPNIKPIARAAVAAERDAQAIIDDIRAATTWSRRMKSVRSAVRAGFDASKSVPPLVKRIEEVTKLIKPVLRLFGH